MSVIGRVRRGAGGPADRLEFINYRRALEADVNDIPGFDSELLVRVTGRRLANSSFIRPGAKYGNPFPGGPWQNER